MDKGEDRGTDVSAPGRHHCLIHRTSEEVHEVVGPFVDEGIALNRKVVLVAPGTSSVAYEIFEDHLARDWSGSRERDQVVFLTLDEALGGPDQFDRYRAITFVRDEIAKARDEGFEGLHLVQDMSLLGRGANALRDLTAYEAGLNLILADRPCAVLCLYDRATASTEVLLRALELHPTELREGLQQRPNPFYQPEVEFRTMRSETLLENRMRLLRRMNASDQPTVTHDPDTLLSRLTRRLDSEALDAETVGRVAAEELRRFLRAERARVLLLDRDEDALVDPDPTVRERDRGTLVARGEGLAGRAWLARRPVWASDPWMAPSPTGDAEATPERSGSGLALPLPGGHTIQGVIEFTFEELDAPSEPLLDRLEPIARLVGETLARIRAEHRAGGSGERLGGLLAGAGEGIVVTDPTGRIQSWNLAAARLLETEGGWEVPTGRSFASLLPESSRDRFKRALAVTAAEDQAGHAPSVELRLPPMGPGRPPLSLNLTAWQGDGGERCCVIALRAGPGQGSNGSQVVRSPSAPVASSTEAALLLTGNIRWGGPSILHASQQFCRLTGYSEAELLGRSLRILSGPKTPDEPFTELRKRLAEGEPAWLEITAYRKDGGEFLLRLDVSPVQNDRGQVTHFVATQGDMASDVAVTTPILPTGRDPLTGLANRDLFNKMLRRAIERSRRKPESSFAVLFLDLDGFKDVNDSLGHVLGDQLLVSVARRLEEAVRPGDILVRFGGDEFVILLDHVGGIADVIAVADRVRDRLNRPFRIDGKEVRISASVGIATSETGYTSVDEVVRDADSAMYKAKEEGSGSYRIFDQSLREEARREGKLRSELQTSLDRGEFRLHYQPLMDLRSGRITGLEALLRWDHPERGLVAATEFIEHAEAMRLILPLGRWVIQESCRQLKGWMEHVSSDLPLVLSLNLSARELLDPRAREWFEESLAETGVSAEALRVEIPESFFSRPISEVEAALLPIRNLGVRIGIDDFGKGTIPVGQLHRFPIDFLKLDRSFVADLHRDDGGNGRAVRAILAMAASLGLDVVAPGVETSLQEELLRELSCPTAQGYLFSAPVDAEKAGRLLASGRTNSRNLSRGRD